MTAPENGQAIARPGEARRHTVSTRDRLTLSAQSWGNPNGPAILFVHGFGRCHLSWLPQLRSKLRQDFHLITYDLRGHGESAKPVDPTSYDNSRAWADDLLAVMDTAGVSRVVLVAWSFGARTALDALEAYGEGRLAGLNGHTVGPLAPYRVSSRYQVLRSRYSEHYIFQQGYPVPGYDD